MFHNIGDGLFLLPFFVQTKVVVRFTVLKTVFRWVGNCQGTLDQFCGSGLILLDLRDASRSWLPCSKTLIYKRSGFRDSKPQFDHFLCFWGVPRFQISFRSRHTNIGTSNFFSFFKLEITAIKFLVTKKMSHLNQFYKMLERSEA